MTEIRHAFVLTKWHREGRHGIGWPSTITSAEVAGPPDELKTRLRPWALQVAAEEQLDDGRFLAYLVDLDEDGEFDIHLAEDVEDIIWFYGTEYVPAS